jgi:DNA-binding NtrC family response regulator
MLVSLGYELTLADCPDEARRILRDSRPGIAVVSARMWNGSSAAAWELTSAARVPVLLLPDPAPDGERPAPGLLATVPALLASANRAGRPVDERAATSGAGARRRPPPHPFLGDSPAIQRVARDALTALLSESPVLIEGETGSGKGVLAAWLHRHGPRAEEPFLDLNCAGLSRELLESELFGHERGAFTGATNAKRGLLEVADRGTLFLDEIGDMEPTVQAKLLKVIEEKRFRRVGDTRERQVDVRIIAATRQDLARAVREGRFREDLYYRVGVLSLRMPALRARRPDIPLLARRLLATLSEDLGRSAPVLTAVAEQVLLRHPWPGNLRELRNELERALLAAGGGPIERHHLSLDASPERSAPGETLGQVERDHIESVLADEDGNVGRAARRLGVPRSTLYQKLRAMRIPLRRAPARSTAM